MWEVYSLYHKASREVQACRQFGASCRVRTVLGADSASVTLQLGVAMPLEIGVMFSKDAVWETGRSPVDIRHPALPHIQSCWSKKEEHEG